MNELKVKVQQTPGTVTWNYEDLKKAITNALEVYKTTEYDDSNIILHYKNIHNFEYGK